MTHRLFDQFCKTKHNRPGSLSEWTWFAESWRQLSKWYTGIEYETVYDREHIEEIVEEGYEIVTVYHIPEDKGYGMSSFMFAKDVSNNQFYLSVNNFEEGWNRWGYIKENSKLAIKYREIQTNGKPTPAADIVEIDQY